MVITVNTTQNIKQRGPFSSSASLSHQNVSRAHGQSMDMFQYSNTYDNERTKPSKLSMMVQVNSFDMKLWASFVGAVLLVYFFVSEGGFGALTVLASSARTFGFAILNLKIWITKSAVGVSVKSLQMYSLVYFCSALSIWHHEGYMPDDEVGGLTYQIVEATSFLLSLSAIFACTVMFKKTYQNDCDKFGEWNVPSGFGTLYLVIPCMILALICHPDRNDHFISDFGFAFSMYLEAVALLPQLYMFQRQAKQSVQPIISHFVFALGFGRLVDLVFWAECIYIFEAENGSNTIGHLSLFSQLVQIVLMLDFFYYYYLSMKFDLPLVFSSLDAV